MSRSRIKHSYIRFFGGGRSSNKKSRTFANKKFRRISKIKMENAPIKLREVSDTWDFITDGLAIYVKNPDKEMLRK